MKRLFPLLILGAFILGIAGGGVIRSQIQLNRPCTQDCPNLLSYLPAETTLDNWDGIDKLSGFPSSPGFLLKPSQEHFLFSDSLSCLSPGRRGWLGLGCGGLPS